MQSNLVSKIQSLQSVLLRMFCMLKMKERYLSTKMNKLFKKDVDTELGTNNEEGFGIGLYIVSELLHKYNFNITVETTEKSRTRFTIIEKK